MANVNVTYQEMEAQADKLVSAQQEIDSYLRNLKSQVEGLVQGGFVTDAASGAFEHSYQEFTHGAQQTIEGLHGTIDIKSALGVGTTVALRIPLTLAIIDGLLVRVGTGRYVIPLPAVEECLELSLEEDMRSRGRSFINLREIGRAHV